MQQWQLATHRLMMCPSLNNYHHITRQVEVMKQTQGDSPKQDHLCFRLIWTSTQQTHTISDCTAADG